MFSAGAHALGLGEIEMQSALNQRLDAEIPLRGVSADDSDQISVGLASQEAFDNVGLDRPFALTRLEFAVKQRGDGGYYVHVTSSKPIVEPFMSFLVEVDWPGGNLLREYTVLLDPPVFAKEEEKEPSGATEAEDTESRTAADDAAGGGEIERSAEAEPEREGDATTSAGTDTATDGATAAEDAEEARRRAQRESRKPVFLRIEEDEERAEREAAERARAQAEADARAEAAEADAAGSGGSGTTAAGGPDEYGPVERGESLWNIAARVKRGDMTVQQMMLALLRYNPDAFSGNNINRLKQGYVLRVPDADEVMSVNAQRAIAQVEEQNAVWRQWRGDGRSGTAVAASEQAAGGETPSGEAGGGGEAQLSIVGSDDGGASSDESASATGSSDASESEKLKLTREQLESARMEKKELSSRVKELEETVEKMEKLLSVRNERLNALQEELRKLEEKTGTQVADAEGETGDKAGTEAGSDPGAGEQEAGDQAGGEDEAAAGSAAGGGTDGGDGSGTDGDAGAADGDTQTASAGDTAQDGGEAESGTSADGGETTASAGAEAETGSGETAGGAESADDDATAGDTGTETAETEAGADYVPEDKQATAQDRGLETTRTQPAQETWLDTINNGLAAVAGIFTGAGLGALMGPVGLGALAVVVLGAGGLLMMRRRRAAEEEPEADVDEMAVDTGAHMLAETDVEELQPDADEPGASAPAHDDATDADAESALMAEEFDLGALDEDEGGAGGDRTRPEAAGDTTMTAAAAADDEPEADKDDTIAEADVYLAYGLHKQAEDLLRLALKEQPDGALYREKLLETLYAAGKNDEFVEEAGSFREQVASTQGRAWQRVLAMGREIAPDNALFAEGETQYTAADVAPNRPAGTDLELDDAGGDLDFAFDDESGDDGQSEFSSTQVLDRSQAAAVDGDGGLAGPDDETAPGGGDEADDDLEFDLGDLEGLDEGESGGESRSQPAPTEAAGADSDAGDLEFDLDEGEATQTSAGTAQGEDEGLDFDFDLGDEGGGEAPAEAATAGGEAAAEAGSGDDGLDFDLDLDAGEAVEATLAAAGDDAGGSGDDEGLDFDFDLDDAADTAPGSGETAAAEPAAAEPATAGGDDDEALEIGDLDLGDLDESAGSTDSADAEATAAGSGEAEEAADEGALDLSDLDTGETETSGGGAADTEEAGEFDLSDLDATAEAATDPAGAGSDSAAPDLSDLETGSDGGDDDFDLSEFEAEAAASGTAPAETAAAETSADAGEQTQIGTPTAGGADDDSETGEPEDFDTMLDLARAYIDMGDPDSAANALEEVANAGNEKQRNEAQSLLESVR